MSKRPFVLALLLGGMLSGCIEDAFYCFSFGCESATPVVAANIAPEVEGYYDFGGVQLDEETCQGPEATEPSVGAVSFQQMPFMPNENDAIYIYGVLDLSQRIRDRDPHLALLWCDRALDTPIEFRCRDRLRPIPTSFRLVEGRWTGEHISRQRRSNELGDECVYEIETAELLSTGESTTTLRIETRWVVDQDADCVSETADLPLRVRAAAEESCAAVREIGMARRAEAHPRVGI